MGFSQNPKKVIPIKSGHNFSLKWNRIRRYGKLAVLFNPIAQGRGVENSP